MCVSWQCCELAQGEIEAEIKTGRAGDGEEVSVCRCAVVCVCVCVKAQLHGIALYLMPY